VTATILKFAVKQDANLWRKMGVDSSYKISMTAWIRGGGSRLHRCSLVSLVLNLALQIDTNQLYKEIYLYKHSGQQQKVYRGPDNRHHMRIRIQW